MEKDMKTHDKLDYNDFSEDNAKNIINIFKIIDTDSIKQFLDYVENYYRINSNVDVFKKNNVFINIINYIFNVYNIVKKNNSNSQNAIEFDSLLEIFKLFTEKKYFTELVNPLNSTRIDICEFQVIIDRIYRFSGIYLQDKYSKLYECICSGICDDIRKLCLINKSLIDSIPIESKEIFLQYNMDFYLGRIRMPVCDDQPYKNIIDNSKLIKLYIDLLIARLFQTSPNVVYFDIMSLLKVNKDLHILSNNDIMLYNSILSSVCSNDIDNVQDLVSSLKSINIVEKFYDDMLKARRASEKAIIRDLYKPNDDDLYHDIKYPDAVIYDLRDDGKKFNMVIRAMSQPFSERITNRVQLCCSLIKENMTTPHWDGFIYGYDVKEDSIIWQGETDSGTINDPELVANARSILLPGGSFVLDEINIVTETRVENGETKHIQPKPSFIVAYDEITDKVYNESKRLGIPIYLVRTITDLKDGDFYMDQESDYQFYYRSNNSLSSEEVSSIRR